MNPRAIGPILLALFALALVSRFAALDLRSMHGDEANQAVKAGRLLETGDYQYDPHDHHGPTIYYFTLIPAWLQGQHDLASLTEFTLRSVPAFFSAALVLLLWFFRRDLTPLSLILAATIAIVAAPLSFYGRYYIQETLLVFFTTAAIAGGWLYIKRPGFAPALLCGLSLGLMHATKETAVLSVFAMLASALTVVMLERHGTKVREHITSHAFAKHAAAAVAAAALISALFFSSFLTNPRGVVDSITTYFNYLDRSGGADLHRHPWHFYFERILWFSREPGQTWTQVFVVIGALLGMVVAIRPKLLPTANATLVRFLTTYTVVLTILYSLIAYKTPWSALSFFFGMVLLAGIGYAALIHLAPGRPAKVIVTLLVAAGLVHLDSQTWRLETRYSAHPGNPWVYAHTSTALPRMAGEITALANVHPDTDEMRVYIVQPDGDYWPLPWYLRRLPNIGYFPAIPETPDAPVFIVSASVARDLNPQLDGEYEISTYSLRPGVLRYLFVEQSLWDAYMAAKNGSGSGP